MQDLVLDKMMGQELLKVTETDDGDLELLFTNNLLTCYHKQDCCESVLYLGKKSDNVGVIKNFSLEIISNLDKKDWKKLKKFSKNIDLASYLKPSQLDSESYTVTRLHLSFLSNTSNTFIFLGTSNGYYSESISFKWDSL